MEMSDLYQLGRRLAEIGYEGMGAAELGISNSEFLVLRDLFMNGRSSISETVGRTGLAQSRVSTCVQELVKKGWVTTAADPDDGRRTLARVTPEVKQLGDARRARPAEDALSLALAGVDPDERAELAHALERLRELLVPSNLQVRVDAGADADLLG
jgi:MarR family 2-MHQ and catechol resistance regulon transcriptional repressor